MSLREDLALRAFFLRVKAEQSRAYPRFSRTAPVLNVHVPACAGLFAYNLKTFSKPLHKCRHWKQSATAALLEGEERPSIAAILVGTWKVACFWHRGPPSPPSHIPKIQVIAILVQPQVCNTPQGFLYFPAPSME
jgi:hypothetical protein